MKLLVDIPEGTLERVRDIVRTQDFEDPSEFVLLALENQIAFEKYADEGGDLIPTIENYLSEDGGNIQQSSEKDDSDSQWKLALQNSDFSELPQCPVPTSERTGNGPLWGQYNRIFPVKIVVRQLANGLRQADADRIELKPFQDAVATNARLIGLEIKQADEELDRRRGAKLSSGLPVGSQAGKSMNRFKDQFVGRVNQDGRLTGAAPSLKFVDITSGKDSRIGLTEFGLKFASIANPFLEGSVESGESLSDAEREFYFEHIAEHLPQECDAMQIVVEGIRDGANRPEQLTERVAELNGQWSDAQASTMRTGLVSRMYELGLVTRERVGQRGVAYRLTSQGENVFGNDLGGHQ